MVHAQKLDQLSIWGSRENSQESRTRKETQGRGVGKQFRHFSFWANSRTVQTGKRNERGQI